MDRDQCGWRHVEDPEVGSVELRPALPRVPPSRMALERLAGTGWGGVGTTSTTWGTLGPFLVLN